MCYELFFFQAEDGIRDLVRSRGLGDVYKRQPLTLQEKLDEALARVRNGWMPPMAALPDTAVIQSLSLIHI